MNTLRLVLALNPLSRLRSICREEMVDIPTEITPFVSTIHEGQEDHDDDASSVSMGSDFRENETNGFKIANYLKYYTLYNPSKNEASAVQMQQQQQQQHHQQQQQQQHHHQQQQQQQHHHQQQQQQGTARVNFPPSLVLAWNFFEYQCLPRCFTTTKVSETNPNRKYCRAGPGEDGSTTLYPVIDTPLEDMADFGVGVGMYFQTLRFFAIVTFVAGCLSLPAIYSYNDSHYAPQFITNDPSFGGDLIMNSPTMNSARIDGSTDAGFFEKYSAVCLNRKYQPCPTCSKDDGDGDGDGDDDDKVSNNDYHNMFFSDDGQAFLSVNQCQIDGFTGFFSFVTMIFVIAAVYVFAYLQRRYRISLDEHEQTSSDYSIKIKVCIWNVVYCI